MALTSPPGEVRQSVLPSSSTTRSTGNLFATTTNDDLSPSPRPRRPPVERRWAGVCCVEPSAGRGESALELMEPMPASSSPVNLSRSSPCRDGQPMWVRWKPAGSERVGPMTAGPAGSSLTDRLLDTLVAALADDPQRAVLATDFDGVLAPIVDHPEHA